MATKLQILEGDLIDGFEMLLMRRLALMIQNNDPRELKLRQLLRQYGNCIVALRDTQTRAEVNRLLESISDPQDAEPAASGPQEKSG